MNKFINLNVLKTSPNPWQEDLFIKKFDAYYFLPFPLHISHDFAVLDPWGFINNLNVRSGDTNYTLNVTDSENETTTFKIDYYKDSARQHLEDYFVKANELSAKERFLIWYGNDERWCLLSDVKSGVCVIGVEFKIAFEPNNFWSNYFKSPNEMMQKVGIEANNASFLDRYKPADILVKGNDENPLWDIVYFNCRVASENDKLFYWAQWEQVFNLLHPYLKRFGKVKMYADQVFWKFYKTKDQTYTTGSKAPVGGYQAFTYDNCKKVATKFLTENQHLIYEFEGKQEEADKLRWANPKGLIGLVDLDINGYVDKNTQTGNSSEFSLGIGYYGQTKKKYPINQQFRYIIKKGIFSDEELQHITNELKQIGFAKEVFHLCVPQINAVYTAEKPLVIQGVYSTSPDIEKIISYKYE